MNVMYEYVSIDSECKEGRLRITKEMRKT